MITVDIDLITPCLVEKATNKKVDTVVKKIESHKLLAQFNKGTAWYVDWVELVKENEIYALQTKGSDVIEGLIAINSKESQDALYVAWMVAAPHNNPEICGKDSQKYYGVGGHLFAIAIMKSVEYGFGGAIYGIASSMDKLKHYEKWFGAIHIGILHKLHFIIADKSAVEVVKEYNYEWEYSKTE